MRIFLDANVLFSGSNQNSNIYRFLELLDNQGDSLVASNYAYMEAKRNISIKRKTWEDGFQNLMEKVTMVADTVLHEDVELVEKDRPILGAAIAAKCDYLLTGDKRDFGHLYGKTIEKVKIVSYLQLSEIVGL